MILKRVEFLFQFKRDTASFVMALLTLSLSPVNNSCVSVE